MEEMLRSEDLEFAYTVEEEEGAYGADGICAAWRERFGAPWRVYCGAGA